MYLLYLACAPFCGKNCDLLSTKWLAKVKTLTAKVADVRSGISLKGKTVLFLIITSELGEMKNKPTDDYDQLLTWF